MPAVHLGNVAAIYKDAVLDGEFISVITVHDHDPHDDQLRNITHVDGLWTKLSAQPASWVSCPELPRLEKALSAHFDCPIGDPDEVAEAVQVAYAAPPAVTGDGPVQDLDSISATVNNVNGKSGR
jgi:hypothetical protein